MVTSPLTVIAIGLGAFAYFRTKINYWREQANQKAWEETVRIEQEDWDNCVFMTGSTRGCPGEDHRQLRIKEEAYWRCRDNCLSQCSVETQPTFDQCLDVGPIGKPFTSKGKFKEVYRQCCDRCYR